ncbi:methylmalonyl-CoA carboxyltransferase, partial [Halorubrum sp. Atlit-9R]
MEDRIDELREKREEALKGGGEDRIASQHDKGKMTARERIDYFLDDGTFREFDQFRTHRNHKFGMEETKLPGDGVITGHGEVDGRTVFVFAHDFTVFGGSLGEVFAEKICK